MPSTEARRVDPATVKQWQDAGQPVFFIDVRRHPDQRQIPGAVYYDPEALTGAQRVVLPVPKEQAIVTYCT